MNVAILCFFQAGLAILTGATIPSVWRWSNPLPHGNNINDIAVGRGTTVHVGEKGQIYLSQDLVTWTPADSHTTNALRAAVFFGNRLVISGENGTIVYADSFDDFHVVSLGTTNWLEGLAVSADQVVAVGDAGAIYTSSDGANWQRRSGVTSWLRGVAYGGTRFALVGEGGFVATSVTGQTWQGGSFTSEDLNKITWINDRFWILGSSGTAWTNNLRLNWLNAGLNNTNALFAISGNSSDTVISGDVAVRARIAPATTWQDQINSGNTYPAPAWTYYSSFWDGTSFLLGGRTGMFVEGFRTNATSPYIWLTRVDSPRNWLWSLVRMPDFYAATGDHGTILTSDDGIAWNQEAVPASVSTDILLGVGGSTNLMLACGTAGSILVSSNSFTNVVSTNANGVMTTNSVSLFGVLWNAVEPRVTSNDLQGVANLGSLMVVTGGAGCILTSTNGTSWTKRNSTVTTYLSSATAFPGGLIAVGDLGTILTSFDGFTWTKRASGVTNWIYQVRYVGGKLLAAGEAGLIMTSPDGINWSRLASGASKWLNAVGYVDGTWIIAGDQGTLLASTNFTDWPNVGTITQKSLYGVASAAGQLVISGVEGVILRSQVTSPTQPVNFIRFNRQANQNVFLFSGKPDTRFSLQQASSLTNWAPGPSLEVFDKSGTLLYLQSSNSIPSQHFRTVVE